MDANINQEVMMMNTSTKEIYEDVLNAMQSAEEMGGPEGEQYIKLMEAIVNEASSRIVVFRTNESAQ